MLTDKRNAAQKQETAPEKKPGGEILKKTIWSIAGGKGGTGKTILAANISIGLAVLGYRVIVIDGDLGVPNLHNYFGITRPRATLDDFITKRYENLSDVIVETPLENLRFISGTSNLVGIANMPHARKLRLIRHINNLKSDIIIVDLGAGITINTLDFYNLSSRGIVVSNPEPNANQDAYFFLKNALYRRLRSFAKLSKPVAEALADYTSQNGKGTFDFINFREFLNRSDHQAAADFSDFIADFRPRLIMNKIRSLNQKKEGKWFISLVQSFLGVDMDLVGALRYDKRIIESSEKTFPFIYHYPRSQATKGLFRIVDTLNSTDMPKHGIRTFRQFRKALSDKQSLWH